MSVYIRPVRDLHDQHDKLLVPELVYDPIAALANPIALLRGKLFTSGWPRAISGGGTSRL